MALKPSSPQSSDGVASTPFATPITVESALVRLRETLGSHRLTPNPASLIALRAAVRQLATLVEAFPRQAREGETSIAVLESARALWASDFLNSQPPAEDILRATEGLRLGWPGIVSGMLLTPCWAWSAAPRLEQVPDWLWGHFMRWVLTPPVAAAHGVADAHVSRITDYIWELAGWMERNRGSEAVRAAGEAFLDHASSPILLQATRDLKPYATARGRLIAAIAHSRSGDAHPVATTRAGRALRIGVLARNFADTADNRTLLPILQNLDNGRVELVLFAAGTVETPIETSFKLAAAEFHVLPAAREAQLDLIAGTACDVLLYASDIACATDSFTGLALQRLAPLQAVLPASRFTTGLPAMDLRIIGETTAEPSTERLALLPGSGLAYVDTPPAQPVTPAVRAEFGLPEQGAVFVTGAAACLFGTDVLGAWARLLLALPGSSLLIVQPESADPFLTEVLPARMQQLAGIDPARVVVAFDDTGRAMRLGDFYLDSFPVSDTEALSRAVHAGIPPVALAGGTHRSRTGAAFLRELGAAALVGTDEASYLAIATLLATDESHGAGMREAIASSHGGCDVLAVADGITGLLERAHDSLLDIRSNRRAPIHLGLSLQEINSVRTQALDALAAGHNAEALAATRLWLQGEPASMEARLLHSRALRLAGQNSRALTYALAALTGNEARADVWLEVGESLRVNSRHDDAISAFEAALKIDGSLVAAWIALSELAAAAGHHEFASEAAQAARELSPSDPRVAALAMTA